MLCNANPTSVDPDEAELAAHAQLVDFSGLKVLEVGCGDGRLTWRYAGPPEEVLGIDPQRAPRGRRGCGSDAAALCLDNQGDTTPSTLGQGAA
jgi:hypothetical protein